MKKILIKLVPLLFASSVILPSAATVQANSWTYNQYAHWTGSGGKAYVYAFTQTSDPSDAYIGVEDGFNDGEDSGYYSKEVNLNGGSDSISKTFYSSRAVTSAWADHSYSNAEDSSWIPINNITIR
ncbi:hypothetical protein IAI10_17025 [Clostridium sp. 19966]|uniref:hypothetical protein n=1 Tax=Clostridium sp. 19966 TaxID=2768166 RepID=UPI0028DEBA2B|nr:hypothetical protein [Clostridium sp. 19966]MDT8718372.1 hypothetical protein [Clostridium sp. 19966]